MTKIGRWKHVDASLKKERKELNLAVSIALFIGAATAVLFKVNPGIPAALGLSGMIVVVSHCLSKFAKPSLHTSFAIFSACLVWPNTIASITLFLFTFFIGWSRLYLKRHAPLDLAFGAGIGVSAGFCFHLIIRSFFIA